MPMKKRVWLTIVLAAAALCLLWLFKAPVMSAYISHKMRIPVSIGSIGIASKEMKIGRFSISNPSGYKTGDAFKADTIDCSYQWSELRGDPSVIDRIEIDRIFLGIEFSNPLNMKNNWTELISRMPKRKSGEGVLVKKIIMTNMTVEIRGQGLLGAKETKTIDRMEFSDVSSKEGFPTHQLISQIFGNAGILHYVKDVLPDGPGGIIKKMIPFGNNEKGPGESQPLDLDAALDRS
jgi:hypothetical protein